MSRNLGRIDCAECPGTHEHIVLEGPIRPVTEKEDPGYYKEHVGLLIAEAKCILCHTLYFAWIEWPGQSASYWRLRAGNRFVDLSYRHSFNDEPMPEDTPLFEVKQVITYERRAMAREDHCYRKPYGLEDRASCERWQTRLDATVPNASTRLSKFKAMVEAVGELPSVLAVYRPYIFSPEQCDTAYLEGLLDGTYDGMNGPLSPEERKQAEAELERRRRDT